jgi:TetR/AcrR family transcriptional repressor of mexJK operon
MVTRGRPKSDKKRQQILDAAAQLFASQGYTNTSLETVAAAAGVSKQTIYSHFSSKQEVLREGVKRHCESGKIAPGQLDNSLPPREFLPLFAERFVSTVLNKGSLAMYRLCMSEGENHPEVGVSFFESGPRVVIEGLSEYLGAADSRGELAVDNPHVAASQFLFMVKGMPIDTALLNLPRLPFEIDVSDYIEQCCAMFLRAYAKQPI